MLIRYFGGTANWHRGGHLANAVARAGLDLAELDDASQPRTIKRHLSGRFR